jgi:hypothetical protein
VINVLQFVFYFKYSLTLGENEAKLERELARFEGEQNKDRIDFHKEMARIASEIKVIIIRKIIVLQGIN